MRHPRLCARTRAPMATAQRSQPGCVGWVRLLHAKSLRSTRDEDCIIRFVEVDRYPLLYPTVEGYGVGFPLLVFSVPASGRVR